MASNAIAAYNGAAVIKPIDFQITEGQVALIKQTIMPQASDTELQLFLNLCRAKRLDPLTRQIYAIKPNNQPWQFFASIDGLRIIAERSGKYLGQTAPLWCDRDGEWRDVWLEPEPPSAAKVGVYKAGAVEPTWGVARWASYARLRDGKPQANWATMPDVMLAKCAEALALRKAFPEDLSGLYVREEMDHGERPVETAVPSLNVVVATKPGAPPVNINDDIKRLRESLGWSAQDVMGMAKDNGWNPRTQEGLQAIHARLRELHDTAFGDDEDADEDIDEIIDADFQPAMPGMPARDRWTDG